MKPLLPYGNFTGAFAISVLCQRGGGIDDLKLTAVILYKVFLFHLVSVDHLSLLNSKPRIKARSKSAPYRRRKGTSHHESSSSPG